MNSQNCPTIERILINACGPGSKEGLNEYVSFNTGPSGLDIDSLEICFPNGGCFCNTTCGTKTFVSNPTYIDALNTSAGCATPLFVDAVANNPLPPNALLLVFTGNPPTINYNFSNHCGQGPIYVLFANNTTNGSGRFVNSRNCGTSRYRTITFYFNANCGDTVTWDRCQVLDTDGEVLMLDSNGSIIYGTTDGCTVLPSEPYILLRAEPHLENGYFLKWDILRSNLSISRQWVVVSRDPLSNATTEKIEVPVSTNELLLSSEHLPSVAWVEVETFDGAILTSNWMNLFKGTGELTQLIAHSFPQLVNPSLSNFHLEIIRSDGVVVHYGDYGSVHIANEDLKHIHSKLNVGLYILRVNGQVVGSFTKLR